MIPPHICSMCIKTNKVGKQEVGIWRVQKRFPQYGIPIWSLWPNIRFLPSIVAEKNATKYILDGRTDRGKTAGSIPPPVERGYTNKYYKKNKDKNKIKEINTHTQLNSAQHKKLLRWETQTPQNTGTHVFVKGRQFLYLIIGLPPY